MKLQLGDTIRRPGTWVVQVGVVGSRDPFLLAGDAGCHQLYKPPGSTTGGLLLFSRSGELILV